MNPRHLSRLLALIAAPLAWAAALIRYVSDGEVSIPLIAAGAFISGSPRSLRTG